MSANATKTFREQLKLTQSELAEKCGISRQLLSLIERDKVQPSVQVALKLARVLETSVEALFSTPDRNSPSLPVTLVDTPHPRQGQRLQIYQVQEKWIATRADHPERGAGGLSPADGLLEIDSTGHFAQLGRQQDEIKSHIAIAGCDPALSLARYAQGNGKSRLIIHHCGSQRSLEMLREGLVHIAGFHYPREETGGNLAMLQKHLHESEIAVFRFSNWSLGWMLAPGLGHKFSGIQDLAQRDLTLANREPGSGARVWLDSQLMRLGVTPLAIKGYDSQFLTHYACAHALQNGLAQVAMGPHSVAELFGLDFKPFEEVEFDLAVRKTSLELPAVTHFLDSLTTRRFQQELNTVGGYSTSMAGSRVL